MTTLAKQTTIRDSNIELLRIICMFFIVVGHFIRHSYIPNINVPLTQLNFFQFCHVLLFGFCYVAVNVFILISGYYRIKFKTTRLLFLYLMCSFYAFANTIFCVVHLEQTINLRTILNVLFPISNHERLWFVNCYVILFFMSPILNRAIDYFSKTQYRNILIGLSFINIYFGYFWHSQYFNINGYNSSQFVYLYLIGGYISKYVEENTIKGNKRFYVLVYCLMSLLWGGITILIHYVELPFWQVDAYNNPILLLSSIAFFFIFLCFRYKNEFINKIAGSVLAVYLVQDCYGFGTDWLYPKVHELLINMKGGGNYRIIIV